MKLKKRRNIYDQIYLSSSAFIFDKNRFKLNLSLEMSFLPKYLNYLYFRNTTPIKELRKILKELKEKEEKEKKEVKKK